MPLRRFLILLLCLGLLLPLQPGVSAAPALQDNAEIIPGELVVGLRPGISIHTLALPAQAAFQQGRPGLEHLNVAVISVPPGQERKFLAEFKKDKTFRFVEPNYRVKADVIPNDADWPLQYGPALIRAPEAWDVTTGSNSVILAVIDSGIDASHPEFSGRIASGYDFVQDDVNPQDECGHGTHVAGIAAAAGNNAAGIAGIAWNVRIMPVRVLDRTCNGSTADVAEALVWAIERGARVINLSLGAAFPSVLMENASYYAYRRGAALIGAAGNGGWSQIIYPARYDWVLAVGAVDASLQRAAFSNTGPQLDLMAPGVAIYSTFPTRAGFFYNTTCPNGNNPCDRPSNYGYLDGTSMAAPHAAGAAALLASLPAFDQPEKIYQALTATALDLESSGRDDNTGYGLLQVAAAMAFDPDDFPPPPQPDIAYDVMNSVSCGNLVEYQWRDAFAIGTGRVFAPGADEGYAAISLPFNVDFGGQTYASVTAHSNGYLALGLNNAIVRDNFLIPGIAQPNNFIAPFWDDLTTDTNGVLYTAEFGNAPGREFVIEWTQMRPKSVTNGLLRFEIVLFENSGDILVQYHTLNGALSDGASASIGLEFADGQAGREYAYNRARAVHPGMALLFRPYASGDPPPSNDCQNFTRPVDSGGGFFDAPPFCVFIPQDALQHPATLQIIPLVSAPHMPGGFLDLQHYADITLSYSPAPPLSPLPEVYVCYHYTPQDVRAAGGHPENLFIAAYNSKKRRWNALPTSADLAQQIIIARAPHLSIYGVATSSNLSGLPETGAFLSREAGLGLLGIGTVVFLCLGLRWYRKRRAAIHP